MIEVSCTGLELNRTAHMKSEEEDEEEEGTSALLRVPIRRVRREGVPGTIRREERPSRCARCGAGAGCSAIRYLSLRREGSRMGADDTPHVPFDARPFDAA